MKAIAEKTSRQTTDFYLSTLAPVNHPGETRCGIVDIVMLTVLFLEIAVVMRLFLAN
jgi:hypothetical protein